MDVSADKLELIQTLDEADISNPVMHDVILGLGGRFSTTSKCRNGGFWFIPSEKTDELLERAN